MFHATVRNQTLELAQRSCLARVQCRDTWLYDDNWTAGSYDYNVRSGAKGVADKLVCNAKDLLMSTINHPANAFRCRFRGCDKDDSSSFMKQESFLHKSAN